MFTVVSYEGGKAIQWKPK